MAVGFNFLFWIYLKEMHGTSIANIKATEFFTGYLIEKSLSLDNIFVIAMIFNYFAIPKEYQRRVLLYGVLGAIVMRLILITVGLFLISKFAWILYIFGIFLLITGIKMLIFADHKPELKENPILIWMKNHLSITHELHEEKFTVRQNKKLYFTPLFLVLILIEVTDLIFAVDSIPAIFAITHDPFIVFTSNIFAILGLRALYFLFADMNEQFHYLKYGLAFVLVLIGLKMLVHHWIQIPVILNLGVIVIILAISIIASVYHKRRITLK
jgi:tellurite resistance protein TerC